MKARDFIFSSIWGQINAVYLGVRIPNRTSCFSSPDGTAEERERLDLRSVTGHSLPDRKRNDRMQKGPGGVSWAIRDQPRNDFAVIWKVIRSLRSIIMLCTCKSKTAPAFEGERGHVTK